MSVEQVSLAREIAEKAHAGQFRRDGVTPYIVHPQAVAERLSGDPDAQVVAWLHDVIEDSALTEDQLLEKGITQEQVAAVSLLTKSDDGLTYAEYLEKVASNPLAAKVKIADMICNLADTPTKKQIKKYAQGLLRLADEIGAQ